MVRRHFETFAALERQMNAARQLRAEIVCDAISVAFAPLSGWIRRRLLRITAPRTAPDMSASLQASTGTHRR